MKFIVYYSLARQAKINERKGNMKIIKRRIWRSQRGMTLIEIIAVTVLLGLIFTVVARGIFGKSQAAQAQINVIKMEKLKQSLGQYRLEFGQYPASLQELITPSAEVQASGKLFIAQAEKEELLDIWKNDFIYRTENNNRSFSLTSLGADGVQGGEGANQDVTVRQ